MEGNSLTSAMRTMIVLCHTQGERRRQERETWSALSLQQLVDITRAAQAELWPEETRGDLSFTYKISTLMTLAWRPRLSTISSTRLQAGSHRGRNQQHVSCCIDPTAKPQHWY